MDELNRLVKIVTNRRLPVLPVVDFSEDNTTSKDMQLIRLLEGKSAVTQTQLIKSLYGANDSKSQANFRKLKSRVQHKLLNQLYFLDQSDPLHQAFRKYDLQCIGLLHKAKVLHNEGEYKLAEKLFRKAILVAEEAEFTHYSILGMGILLKLYVEMGQQAKFREMSQRLAGMQDKHQLEKEADQLYSETKLALNLKVRSRKSVLTRLAAFLERLEQIHAQVNSYNTFYALYSVRLAKEDLLGNYEEISRITSLTESERRRGNINEKRFDKRFNNYMSVYAHLQCRQVEQGLELAQEYFKDFHYSSGNWFYFLETYLVLALHAQRYDQAFELLQQAHDNPFYIKQRPAAKERWELYEAYLQFIRPELSPLKMRNFKQFIQKVPAYSLDKQGLNVAILILQFFYFMNRGDIEGLVARLDGLRKYEQRHLRDPAIIRSQLFFRLLFMSMKEGFSLPVIEKKADKILEKLNAASHVGQAYGEVEIIPYEHLWEIMLGILRRGVNLKPAAH